MSNQIIHNPFKHLQAKVDMLFINYNTASTLHILTKNQLDPSIKMEKGRGIFKVEMPLLCLTN